MHTIPVSYTHLDVYKRQEQCRYTPTACGAGSWLFVLTCFGDEGDPQPDKGHADTQEGGLATGGNRHKRDTDAEESDAGGFRGLLGIHAVHRDLSSLLDKMMRASKSACQVPFTALSVNAVPVSYTHLDVYKRQTADCPGPPAIKNTGSGEAEPLSEAGTHAIFSAILRPLGWLRSSGTSKCVHWASSASLLKAELRLHGVNASVPSRVGLICLLYTSRCI